MQNIFEMIQRFLLHLEIINYSAKTIATRRSHLNIFYQWCEMYGIVHCEEVTRKMIDRYQSYVFHLKKKNGQPYKPASQHNVLTAVRVFFQWLSKKSYLEYNPTSELEMPKVEKPIPQTLSIKQIEQIIAIPDIETFVGLRDRAILETFYATGIRREELCNLKLWSIDSEKRTVFIEKGKGNKDRIIPIGKRALKWIEKYKQQSRQIYSQQPDTGFLFINIKGTRMHPIPLGARIKNYMKKAGLNKKGACHIFRHSTATILLERGADIRHIQELLGHKRLSTTQIYTHVNITKLQEVYEKTHPAKLESTHHLENELPQKQNIYDNLEDSTFD